MQRRGPTQEDKAFVDAALHSAGTTVPLNFTPTAPDAGPTPPRRGRMPRTNPRNPQTEALLQLIGCDWNLGEDHGMEGLGMQFDEGVLPGVLPGVTEVLPAAPVAANPEEVMLDDDDDGDDDVQD